MVQASLIFDEQLNARGGTKIPVGIHANVKVTSIERGANYYDINFETQEGLKHNKRVWDPNGNYPKENESPAEAIQRETNQRAAHLVKLVHIFLGKEAIASLPKAEYGEFVDSTIKLLSKVLPTKTVNLKLIYDSEGVYSEIPNFPGGPSSYIEEYVEGQSPTLIYSTYEIQNRMTPKSNTPIEKDSRFDDIF